MWASRVTAGVVGDPRFGNCDDSVARSHPGLCGARTGGVGEAGSHPGPQQGRGVGAPRHSRAGEWGWGPRPGMGTRL